MQKENVSIGRVRLGGLWLNQDQDGKKYLGGTFGNGLRISVRKNKFKRNASDPDYEIILVEAPPKKQVQKQKPQVKPQPQPKQEPKQEEDFGWYEEADDDLPFDN